MKRVFIVALAISLTALLASPAAALNLLTNPGFEDPALSGWNSNNAVLIGGLPSFLLSEAVLSGNQSAGILETGSLTQTVTLSDAPTHTFGTWYRVITDSLSGNFDQIQTSFKVNVNGATQTTGGSVSNIEASHFSAYSFFGLEFYLSDWIYMEGIIDTLGLAGETALFNINVQNYAQTITGVAFDDAFVTGQPIPEPGTIMLLGAGILGLGIYGRKKPRKFA